MCGRLRNDSVILWYTVLLACCCWEIDVNLSAVRPCRLRQMVLSIWVSETPATLYSSHIDVLSWYCEESLL